MSKITPEAEKYKVEAPRTISINAEWRQQILKVGRMVHPRPGSETPQYDEHGWLYKICPCCGTKFHPTPGHERDQLYCKCPECKRLRTNLRQNLYYRRQMSDALSRICYCERKKLEREARKRRMGIEPAGKFGWRRRNSVRGMKAEIDRKLNNLQTCFNGMLVTFGFKTQSDVSEAMNNFREKGQELRYACRR